MKRLALTVLLCAVALAAARADDPTFTISLRDHQFVPSELAVPVGVKVQLLVKNDQQVVAEFESSSLHREKVVSPGGQIQVFVGPLDPGSYEFFDDFHGETRGHLIAK